MTEHTNSSDVDQAVDQAVAEGGAYEVLRKRLNDQGKRLTDIADTLNATRLAEFGDSRMEIAGRARIRSEHNAVGRDIVQVAGFLLFGYNVFLGLKGTTSIQDVFGLYRLVETEGGYDVTPVDHAGTFLADPVFERDFAELYNYYKDARLSQLMVRDSKLLAVFQVGLKDTDVKVFRWNLASSGEVSYIDARGDRDISPPPPFDFEWTVANKDNEVSGRFPHLNILDAVFVETTGGDLTIKVENNTETGKGIYSEPVDDKTQSLDDAQVAYARLGSLILIKVLPFRESKWRGLIFNTVTRKVVRMDAINQACVQLPEDHGIIFPGGYYLQNGEHRAFDASMADMAYKRAIRSPNGEDVLYIFYNRVTGTSALLVYNMVRRQLAPPLFAHGYARLGDGRMVLFHAENDDPTRVHQLQVWTTPFFSDEYAAAVPASTTELGKIGNAELVRAVSDLYDLGRSIGQEEVSSQRYQSLVDDTRRLFDVHHWIEAGPIRDLAPLLHQIAETSESVLDEFEKVQQIRLHSEKSLEEAAAAHRSLLGRLQPAAWTQTQEFVDALNEVVALRGRLMSLREYRYIDVAALDAMSESLAKAHDEVGVATGQFLSDPKALAPLEKRLSEYDTQAQKAETAVELTKIIENLDGMSSDLDMLSELMASLKVDDATQRTRVVEALSALYSRLNQSKARAAQKRKGLGSAEAVAQFGAQFTLFGQSVASALGMATTPEKADEQLARLLVQLEELETQFGEHEQFLGDILTKREELLEAFESHKQSLLDARQRTAQAVADAATRILDGLGRRAERYQTQDELNAFFVGDALIQKLRDMVSRLRDLRDAVRADDIEAKIKGARDQAVRALRDRSDLFEEGGAVIKLGPRHRFSVNTQPLDLTILPREDHLSIHLTGTDYSEPLVDARLDASRPYWSVALESESDHISRAEYLAGQVFAAAKAQEEGLDLEQLRANVTSGDGMFKLVRDYAASRYKDGYEKGIHDHDAALILSALVSLDRTAGALRFQPAARALAMDFWASLDDDARAGWEAQASATLAIAALGPSQALPQLEAALTVAIEHTSLENGRAFPFEASSSQAAAYLVACFSPTGVVFEISPQARRLADALTDGLAKNSHFESARAHLSARPDAALALVRQGLDVLVTRPDFTDAVRFIPEAATLFHYQGKFETKPRQAELSQHVRGLLSQHARIQDGQLVVAIDDLLPRHAQHVATFLPGFRQYQELRQEVISQARAAMRLEEFKPKPLSSFVRNKLINDVYLPVIGDNLAKQMGTVGESKRSDLMGLLMMISPPGYGKTTLMEYVASRLGLVFMKINGPALGHDVRSLDPVQAPDATSRQELEKLNLALEMGSNVMLYVDDIQHTHPEFLQKFISLCDGTRRIEGVWRGKTKTYDMRGRKFAVVMAGNPYTESGEVFKIPDMLANRADIYNLGDVLGGMEDSFVLSYIENSLTSNPVLAPMATRDMSDLYLLIEKAQGKDVSTNGLKHPYSAAEINEIVSVLERLLKVRDVVYRVNQQYIASAAQADEYRTEPAFKLQGSYRNMNKMAEKISPAMNMDELHQLVSDHYLGESQLLTTGAEENLLKLGEIRGVLTPEQAERWQQIKDEFRRHKRMGGADSDVGTRVVSQLSDISEVLRTLGQDTSATKDDGAINEKVIEAINSVAMALASREDVKVAPRAAKSSEKDYDALSMVLEKHLDSLAAAIIQAVERPVRISYEGGAPALPSAPAPVAPAAPAPARRRKASSSDVAAPDVQAQASPALEQASDKLSSDLSGALPAPLIEKIVSSLSAHQHPLLMALRDRLDDQAMLGRALALMMERLANSPVLFSTADGPRRQEEFDRMLGELKFRYTRPQS